MKSINNLQKIILATLLFFCSAATVLSAGELKGNRFTDATCRLSILLPANWQSRKATDNEGIIIELFRNDETASISIVTIDTGEELDVKAFRKLIEPEILSKKERKKLKPLTGKTTSLSPEKGSDKQMQLYTSSSSIYGYPVQVLLGYHTRINLAYAVTAIYLKTDQDLQQEVYDILRSLVID